MDMINEAGKGEKTKYRLARSMKECMKTMSVDNITVKQISFWRNPLSIWEWGKLFMMLW